MKLRSRHDAPALALSCAGIALLLLPGLAQAHSAPGVAAIVDEDASGVHVLRLYDGLALRSGDAWHFVCSSLYQGVGQDPAAALPGGGVAIAAPDGLWILKRDGSLAPHPDPAAQDTVTAFARGPGALYALRMRRELHVSDVIEVTADKVRVVWTDTGFWTDIAMGSSFLELIRFEQDTVEELRLSFQGEVVQRLTAALIDPLDVSIRIVADTPYLSAKLESGAELGRIEQASWQVLQRATNSIAGPVDTADGRRFVALDGQLSSFDADVVAPRSDDDFVIGLSRLDDHSYACTRTGLRDLSSVGLGETRFDLSQLQGPDPCFVPQAMWSDCNLEWQHVQVELLGADIPLAPATAATACAPLPVTDTATAGSSAVAMPAPPGVSMPPAASVPAPVSDAGCSVVRQCRRTHHALALAVVAVCALAASRRRRRSGRS